MIGSRYKMEYFKIDTAVITYVVAFILQALFFIAYGCFGEPLANISNLPVTSANPPKEDSRTKIYFFSDWKIKLANNVKKEDLNKEEEKVIQPRDDSGDQIMEGENSLNKRVLILLGNKSKKKGSVEYCIKQEIDTESDSIPFGNFKKSEV